MTALAYLQEHDLQAEVLNGDQIAVWPEESITPDLELWITEHKARLVSELSSQSPDTVIVEIAQSLNAEPRLLRSLLSADDIQAISEGCPGYDLHRLKDYFLLMENDGKPLRDDGEHCMDSSYQRTQRSRQEALKAKDQPREWRPAHDSFIGHVMTCSACIACRDRYCSQGADLRQTYLETYQKANSRSEHNEHL